MLTRTMKQIANKKTKQRWETQKPKNKQPKYPEQKI